jgi:GR25 family glycosyltransferase involved in LPS biosynthesis
MKAFVIYLSKIQSSKMSGEETYRILKRLGFDAELFEGTYGNDAEEMFFKENRTLFNRERHKKSKSDSPGAKGCFHSHYRLWEKCVELNETISIWEDDVVFKRPLVPIEFEDVLALTINYDWKMTNPYRQYLEKDFPITHDAQYPEYCMPGAGGYLIKPHAAKRLVDQYKNHYLTPDWAINSEICKIKLHPRPVGRTKTYNEKVSLTRNFK